MAPIWSIYSLTKYVGGHSDLVAGAVLGTRAALKPIRSMRSGLGTMSDPHTGWLLMRSLETLELRMTRAGENAAKVAAYLRGHPAIEKVGYLGFLADGSPQADIYCAAMRRAGLDHQRVCEGRRSGGVPVPGPAGADQACGEPGRDGESGLATRRR